MKKKKLLFYFYNRLNDPLLQSNIFQYINELVKSGAYDISIITYEDARFPLSEDEKNKVHAGYKKLGMHWHPLTWHAGSSLHLKAIDILTGFFKLFYLSQIRGYRRVITLGSIAGSFVYLFSRLFPVKFYLYQYEPHSEYALDNKLWAPNSLQYKLLNAFEKRSVIKCSVVSSGTISMQKRLEGMRIKAKFFKVASVVNDRFFYFDIEKRNAVRTRFGIAETDKLILYPGKLGELYCNASQLLGVFKTLHRHNPAFKFLAITPNKAELDLLLANEDTAFTNNVTVIPAVSHHEVPAFLSSADLGIVAVLPGFSKKFMSPIKIGEYLCCGLPYIICRDLEDSGFTAQKNVGVVVNDFSEPEISLAFTGIIALLQEPKQQQAQRCHAAGIALRGFEAQYREFAKAIAALTD